MAEFLTPVPGVAIPLGEVGVRVSRSGGPGGQHANVTSSRVEASFDVRASSALQEAQRARLIERFGPVVRAVAQDERSQSRNRQLALRRLEARLAEGLRPVVPRVPTRTPTAAKRRRLADKQRRAQVKQGRRPPAEQ